MELVGVPVRTTATVAEPVQDFFERTFDFDLDAWPEKVFTEANYYPKVAQRPQNCLRLLDDKF